MNPLTVVNTSTVPITGTFTKVPQKYLCSDCDEIFPTKKALSRHSQTHHKFSLSFDDTSNDDHDHESTVAPANHAARNLRRGKGNSPARSTCTICGVQTLRQHMARHMLKHSGVKPYKCSHCDAKFARKDKYSEHMRKHENMNVSIKSESSTGEPMPKEHSCRKCGFKTTDKAEFRVHQKSHPSKNSYK